MTKVQAINTNEYLQETLKAHQVLKERVDELRRSPGPDAKVGILKDLLEKTKSYEEQKEIEKELEKQRYLMNKGETVPMMPPEHREKIMGNLEVEIKQVDNVLKEQYEQLNKLADGLNDIHTLVSNINQLEHLRKIVPQIIKYRDGSLYRDMPSYVFQEVSFTPHFFTITPQELKGEDVTTILSNVKSIKEKVSKLHFTKSEGFFYGGKK